MAVFEMLAKMVCAEKLLGLVAFTKLVVVADMVSTCVPVRRICEFCTAKAASVGCSVVRGTRVKDALNSM